MRMPFYYVLIIAVVAVLLIILTVNEPAVIGNFRRVFIGS